MVVVIVLAGFVLGILAALLGLTALLGIPADDGRDALPSGASTRRPGPPAADELVETLRALIRIPSINPPPADAPDGERGPRDWIAAALADAGLRPEVLELVPGRGSVVARLRGDGTGGEPLLLLSPPRRRAGSRRAVDPRPVRRRTSRTARSGVAARST